MPAVDYRERDPETGGLAVPRRVRSWVHAFLDAAASLAIETALAGQFVLAMPLLGAVANKLGPVASLDTMMNRVHEHLRGSSPKERDALAQIVFVVLRPEDARLVERAAANTDSWPRDGSGALGPVHWASLRMPIPYVAGHCE